MNSKLSFIFSRRSVRTYLAKDIPPETVHDLIEAAMAAPSACCKDPWAFVAIRDKARLRDMSGEKQKRKVGASKSGKSV
jgi:nitroreductase